eukprot:3050101-Prymnesium_polylepis.1
MLDPTPAPLSLGLQGGALLHVRYAALTRACARNRAACGPHGADMAHSLRHATSVPRAPRAD